MRVYFIGLLFFSLVGVASADTALNQGSLSHQKDNQILIAAEIAYLDGKYEEAYKHYKAALKGLDKDTPGYFTDYYWMGKSLLALGRYKEARDIFQVLINQNINAQMRIYGYYALGETYFYDNQFKKAEKEYKSLLNRLNGFQDLQAMTLYRLGIIRDCLKDELGAEELLYTLRTKFPESYAAIDSKAVYYVQLGAFRSKENAERLQDNLMKKDYPIHIDIVDKNNTRFYRVRMGRFLTMQRARLALRDVEQKEAIDATIMKEGR